MVKFIAGIIEFFCPGHNSLGEAHTPLIIYPKTFPKLIKNIPTSCETIGLAVCGI